MRSYGYTFHTRISETNFLVLINSLNSNIFEIFCVCADFRSTFNINRKHSKSIRPRTDFFDGRRHGTPTANLASVLSTRSKQILIVFRLRCCSGLVWNEQFENTTLRNGNLTSQIARYTTCFPKHTISHKLYSVSGIVRHRVIWRQPI